MRLYINGTFDKPQEHFLLSDLFFANENADDSDIPGYDCIMLSGHECETSCDMENSSFSCRWKGVDLACEEEYTDDNDDNKDISRDVLFQLVRERNLVLANAYGYPDEDVTIKITSITLVDGEWEDKVLLEDEFGDEFLANKIEFIL